MNQNIKDIKSVIKHKRLNILTTLSLGLFEDKIIDISMIKKLLKSLTILIEYENIFLKEKPEFFIQNTSIEELLETRNISCQKRLKQKNIIKLIPKNSEVAIDKYYIGKSIDMICEYLCPFITQITFIFNPKNRILNIKYTTQTKIHLKKLPLDTTLRNMSLEDQEIFLQLALEILELHHCKVQFSHKSISIQFPH